RQALGRSRRARPESALVEKSRTGSGTRSCRNAQTLDALPFSDRHVPLPLSPAGASITSVPPRSVALALLSPFHANRLEHNRQFEILPVNKVAVFEQQRRDRRRHHR